MIRKLALISVLAGLLALPSALAPAAELTAAAVANAAGDGPDGKGNTADDSWQFWFRLVHADEYRRLDIGTAALPAAQRKGGIPRKVSGPVASGLPNPDQTNGWIYHSDWDGRFEGIWGDTKTGAVYAHPYAEKTSHMAVALSYRIPADGAYNISGTVTDVQVVQNPRHQGISWTVDVVTPAGAMALGKADRVLGEGGPVGDKVGPDSQAFSFENVELKAGQQVRLIIDPNKWWGTDLTQIENLRIVPAE